MVEIKKDWNIPITVETLVKWGNPRRSISALPTATLLAYERAVAMGANLARPAAIYKDVKILENLLDKVTVEEGVTFKSPHLASLLDGAERLVVMCHTIGPDLENAVTSLQDKGDVATAFALDLYGSVAVSLLGRNVFSFLQERARRDGFETTVHMSPGQLDWSVRDQVGIFRLLNPEVIGVVLTPSFMMKPVKSSTAVFGYGPAEKIKKGALACERCPKRHHCTFRGNADEE